MRCDYLMATLFQSTLPRRERLTGWLLKNIYANFNPRSRDGSDVLNNRIFIDNEISIHAPAKGATRQPHGELHEKAISIHAPAKGATAMTVSTTDTESISIHAPAKGATPQ